MRPNAFVLSASLILCVFTLSQAPCFSDDAPFLTKKLVRISGLRSQLQQFPNAFLMTIPRDLFPENRSLLAFTIQMKKRINPDDLIELVEQTLGRNRDIEKLDLTIKFYESSLGRKLGRIQGDALSAYNIKSIREARKVATSLTQDREKLFERIIKSQRIYENNYAFRKSIAGILGQGSLEIMGGYPEKFSRGSMDPIRETVLTCFAFTYRSLSEAELKDLANFEETDAAAWFESNVATGFKQVISKTLEVFSEELRNLRNESGD